MTQSTETILALIQSDISNIKADVSDIKSHLEKNYLTKVEFNSKFNPVKNVVYGAVGLILTSVVVALIGLVVLQ